MTGWGHRLMAGLKAFREAYLSTGADTAALGSAFGDWQARQLRYAVLWAYFENDAYRDVHSWARAYRADYGLYKYIRNIYNPAQRLGTFWETHLMGGALDPEAGDGTGQPSALPILTDNRTLRPALATLWRDSNWSVNKQIYALRGATLGDTVLRVVDDVARQRVYLEALHPGLLAAITRDPFGHVKSYRIEEQRPNPLGVGTVVYVETATRDGENVVYRTLLNGAPYAWNGVAAEWAEPYGFVPLVAVKHRDVGLDWGWSELHPALAKIRETDDLASKLDDQIRKLVDAPWLFAGVDDPRKPTRAGAGAPPSTKRPEPGREEMPVLYGPTGATATALVAPLDISATGEQIQRILQALESDYPELSFERLRLSGDASGQALRVARQPAESKVQERRTPYDDGLVRAQQMAVAIGGWRGYRGYESFGLESYRAGALNHRIGNRPVFGSDPIDQLEEQKLFWEVAKIAREAGVRLEVVLEQAGWPAEKIRRAIETRQSTPPQD